jgi:hypothetical protein
MEVGEISTPGVFAKVRLGAQRRDFSATATLMNWLMVVFSSAAIRFTSSSSDF